MADSSDQNVQPTTSLDANSAVSHPLQDVALDVTDDAATAGGKQKWVKFDDDDEANQIRCADNAINGEGNTTRTSPIATGGQSLTAEHVTPTAMPTPANRLSISAVLPAPPSRRQPAVFANATIPITTTTTAAIARPRSPRSGSSTDVNVTAPAERRTASSPTSVPDIAPAVLNTESTHVNLNASGRSQHHQQQQQHAHVAQSTSQQQLQQAKLSPTNAATATSGNHLQQQQQQQQQQRQQQYHNNNGTPPLKGSVGGSKMSTITTKTTTATAAAATSNVSIPVETVPPMRTIELSTGRIREGFANGDVIVTLLPANTKWPWITPAIFRPELVPEELMAQGLTLTVEEYVNAMETLVNDFRFTIYNICYKRILICWIVLAFTVLLALLFSGLQGLALFSLGVGWLFLNAAAIFLCMWVKLRLSRGLEKCLARVNRQLMKHKILLILDDRGRISCHKVNLCFLYFDATQCVSFLNEFLEHTEQNGGEAIKAGWEQKLDIDVNDIVIQGTNPVRLSRKQERGTRLVLRYASRWGMEALRGLIDVTPLEPGRHCGQFQCPCQYIKDHLQYKPRGKLKCLNCIYWVLASERYD